MKPFAFITALFLASVLLPGCFVQKQTASGGRPTTESGTVSWIAPRVKFAAGAGSLISVTTTVDGAVRFQGAPGTVVRDDGGSVSTLSESNREIYFVSLPGSLEEYVTEAEGALLVNDAEVLANVRVELDGSFDVVVEGLDPDFRDDPSATALNAGLISTGGLRNPKGMWVVPSGGPVDESVFALLSGSGELFKGLAMRGVDLGDF